ncbi:MAG: ABC transporter permease subunit [Gaiellaceae bacterium]
MIGSLLRRLVLALSVIVALSCTSFCFFTWENQRSLGLGTLVGDWWVWVRGLWGGPSLHLFEVPIPTRNFTAGTSMFDAVGHTAVLLGLALLLTVLGSVGLALVAAARRGSALDFVLRVLSYAAWAVPAFLLALLVQLLAGTLGGDRGIGPFPLAGWPGTCPAGIGLNAGHLSSCPAAGSGIRYALNVLRYATLPTVTLTLGFVGLHARYLRSALLETMGAPFVTTARAKGLPERRVLVRHGLRASLGTFVGALFSDFGAILGTALAVDFVFQFNGLGTMFISGFPQGPGGVNPVWMTSILTLAALLVTASSLLGDLAVRWLDPRMRTSR